VAAKADRLVAEGIEPGTRNIREQLGTGSANTIYKHLTAWSNSRPPATSVTPDLPAGLLREMAQVLSRAVAEGRAEPEARLVQVQAVATELSTEGEELEAERDRLHEQISDISAQRNALSVEVAAQAADIVRLTAEVGRERQATDLARTEVAQTRNKIDAQADKISEQAADILRLKAARETEAKGRAAAEQAAAVKDAKLEAAQELLQAAHHDINRLIAQVDQEHQTALRERERADEEQKMAASAREELAGLKAQLAVVEKKRHRPKTRQHGSVDLTMQEHAD
jgi:chromosome segregation ATPase